MLATNHKIKGSKPCFHSKTSLISILLALFLIMPTITTVVKADDIIVDDDGSGDYLSIQDAINNANPGDTIWVKDGSYNEQLTIPISNLSILVDNGAMAKLYLTSYIPGIDISGSNVVIDGFRIYGNSDVGSGGPTIRLASTADRCVFRDNTFLPVTDETGYKAMLIETGSERGVFRSNIIQNYDYGIELQEGTSFEISSNTFSNVNHTIIHASRVEGSNIRYGSIQDAIDIANEGNEVIVTPGLFTGTILINKSLDLTGAMDGINPTSQRNGFESVIDGVTTSAITIPAETENVTIDGFTLTISAKDAGSNQAGILMGPGVKNIDILNNIINDITDGTGTDTVNDESYGIMVYGRDDVIGGQQNILIKRNLIQNVEEYAIAINDNTSLVTITGNKIIELITADHSLEGYPPWDSNWPLLICSAIHLGGQVGPITDITIDDNILMTNQTGDGALTGAGSGISFGGVDESLGNRTWQGFQNIEITDNIISNNAMGSICLVGNGSVNINDNNISGNSQFGINNYINAFHYDATDNWWGNITGPYNATDNPTGLGDEIYGNVTFWPWYEFDSYSIMPFVEYDVGIPNVNNGEIIKSSTEIDIDAQDNQSGMYSLQYRIWNTTHRWSEWMNYTTRFTLDGQGEHRVQVNATDNAGTSTYLGDFNYHSHRVDDVSPEVKLKYPNGGEVESADIPIEWDAYDEIFDQGQLMWNGSLSLTADYPGHIQSFMPTEDEIDSVQLLMYGDDANVSVQLFSQLYPIPQLIGHSMLHLENMGTPTSPAWIDFPFASTINLDTTQTYYIGVTQEIYGNTGFNWLYHEDTNYDTYPYGHAWIKSTDELINRTDMDYAFKTMYWDTDLMITVQYSITGVSPWSTIAEGELNDGIYIWDTSSYGIPDGNDYRVRVLASDEIENLGFGQSMNKFMIDNEGPGVSNIVIKDTTIESTQYTKHGDNLEITATIGGDPEIIEADFSKLGKGTNVEPTSFTGGVAKWTVNDIFCIPANGDVSVTVFAMDATGESSSNTGSITADNSPPEVTIIKPLPGLYVLDSMRLLPFSYPFIIGQITVEAEADDNGSGIDRVEFYLENDLEANVTQAPFTWLWDRAATGFFTIEVKAVDAVGHTVTRDIDDLFILNFDIIGHT